MSTVDTSDSDVPFVTRGMAAAIPPVPVETVVPVPSRRNQVSIVNVAAFIAVPVPKVTYALVPVEVLNASAAGVVNDEPGVIQVGVFVQRP